MLGGFGIKSIDNRTGEQKYTPIRVSSSWLNVVYGQKWKPGIFLGYVKNMGTSDALSIQSSIRNRNQCGPSGDSRR